MIDVIIHTSTTINWKFEIQVELRKANVPIIAAMWIGDITQNICIHKNSNGKKEVNDRITVNQIDKKEKLKWQKGKNSTGRSTNSSSILHSTVSKIVQKI